MSAGRVSLLAPACKRALLLRPAGELRLFLGENVSEVLPGSGCKAGVIDDRPQKWKRGVGLVLPKQSSDFHVRYG